MKITILALISTISMTSAFAQAAHSQVQVSARVNAYVRASNSMATPTVQTNSHDVACKVENKNGYTLVTC